MEYRNLIFELNDNIAAIKFNRPKALNALNTELIEELSRVLDEIAENEDIKVLILTGEGDKSFVAGADISELATFNALEAKNFSQSGHSGHFLMALDVARWMPLEAYYARIESLVAIVKSSHPNRQVLLPGEIRWQNYQDNITNGIALESSVRTSLLTLSQPNGIKAPW